MSIHKHYRFPERTDLIIQQRDMKLYPYESGYVIAAIDSFQKNQEKDHIFSELLKIQSTMNKIYTYLVKKDSHFTDDTPKQKTSSEGLSAF
ncbi:MAG: hypothetical protein Q4E53_10375 [Eubacteriales bacterium]|nr:hypothetical protein [Eubacteriales bacterium]